MPKFYEIKAQDDGSAELWMIGVIGDSEWSEVNLRGFVSDLNGLGDVEDIHLRVQSNGGSVFAGVAIHNVLKNHPAKITGYVEGIAASMATVVLMACDSIVMPSNALFMIHDPWTGAVGNSKELRRVADLLDKTNQASVLSAYMKKTGQDEETIKNLMAEETWLTAEEALEYGFIDEISDAVELAACVRDLDLSHFKNTPNNLILSNLSDVPDDTTKRKKAMPKPNGNDNPSANPDNPQPQAGLTAEQVKAQATAAAQAAVAAERQKESQRREGILAVFQPFGSRFSDLKAECLAGDTTKEQAQEKLLAKLGEGSQPLGHDVIVIHDQKDKVASGFQAALMSRAGLAVDKPTNEFRGYSLSEMARHCLEMNNVSTRHMDRMEMVGAAFTHSSGDFPNLLQNVMHKTMLKGWDEAPETFQLWTSKGMLTDFKPTKRVDINSFPSLREVPAGAEYKYATVGDRGETTQLATYGELIALNRQTIINDDLNAFSKLPMMMGRAARRTIGNLVYAILTGNPQMSDSKTLFHSDHGNLGTAGVPSTSSLDEMRKLMALQKDGGENATALGIRPAYALVPEALLGKMSTVLQSEYEVGASSKNNTTPNSVRNLAEPISDARLDAASETAWYLAASGALHDTIEVSYLDGIEQPFLDQMKGWNVDGTEYKVRIDAGVKPLDWRTLCKNAGQ